MKRVFAMLCLGLAASGARAESLDINLSDDTLRGTFSGPLSHAFPRLNGVYEFGALTGEQRGVRFTQGHAGMLVTGDAGARDANVNAGLGGRIVLLDAEDVSGGALQLGGTIEARLPAFNRLGLIAYLYGSPNASTFGDFDSFLEYAIDADYQVLQGASIYAGYRQLKVGLDGGGRYTVDNGFHLGLRLNF